MSTRYRVLKVGGSLLDWPELPMALTGWLEQNRREALQDVLVVGGGLLVDAIRQFDRTLGCDAEAAHWAAIGAMDLNAELLAKRMSWTLLAAAELDRPLRQRQQETAIAVSSNAAERRSALPWVCHVRSWLEHSPHLLPCSWEVTSDSIAACLARRLGADTLVLLKSCDAPRQNELATWADQGFVDPYFPQSATALPSVQWVNLRDA